MYKNQNTTEEEFPKTPREMLSYSLELLAQQFPERTVEATVSVPVYEWSGAGSERGGAAEYIKYEKVIFLPSQDGNVVAVSMGNKERRWGVADVGLVFRDQYMAQSITRDYSVLLRTKVPDALAKKLLTFYHEKAKEKAEVPFDFLYGLEQTLKPATGDYQGITLLAFDEDESREKAGFYRKTHSLDGKLLQKLDSHFMDRADMKVERIIIAQGIAEFAQGKKDFLLGLPVGSKINRVLDLKNHQVEKVVSALARI